MISNQQIREVKYKIKSPSVVILAGPTQSGKTTLITNLIRHNAYWSEVVPEEIIYCYEVWQAKFNDLQSIVNFHKGLIDLEKDVPDDGKHRWVILDDMMEEVAKSPETQKAFTVYSHHKNVTIFFLIQNFFEKCLRTITLNAHYVAFFLKSERQIANPYLGTKGFSNGKRACTFGVRRHL